MSRNLFGVATLRMSEGLDSFLALQGNVTRSHFTKYGIAAKWGWKAVMLNTIFSIRQVYVEVDKKDNTIRLPRDMERLLSLSIVDDCNNIQPLTYDPNMNTLRLNRPVRCGCRTCNGVGTLCGLLENIQVRSEPVVINNTIYNKITYNRSESNGTIYQVSEVPVWDIATHTVIIDKQVSVICSCETTPDGCIAETAENHLLITRYFGCFIVNCHRNMCDVAVPAAHNNFGYWKGEANSGSVVHLKHVRAEWIIVGYQSSGNAEGIIGDEIMIPEFAMPAFFAGIQHYSSMYNPKESLASKEYDRKNFLREKKHVLDSMSLIPMDEWVKLGSIMPVWGGKRENHHGKDFPLYRL